MTRHTTSGTEQAGAEDQPGTFGDEAPFDQDATVAQGETLPMFPGFGAAIVAEADPEAAQRSIVKRMLGAQSLDELFAVHEGQSSEHLVGKTFLISGVEWGTYTPSEPTADGSIRTIPLARVTAVDTATDRACDFPTTAPNLTAFLWQAEQLGAFPFRAKIGSVKSSRGYEVLRFERI